jgi:hypothetical protein
MLKNQFIKYTDACVENFLGGDLKSLFSNTKKLSKVVLNNFKPMIPEAFHGIWQKASIPTTTTSNSADLVVAVTSWALPKTLKKQKHP